MMGRLISVHSAADLASVSPRTIRRWIAYGHLHASRPTPRSPYRIDEDDLAKLLRRPVADVVYLVRD